MRIRGYKSIAFCDVTLEPLTILVGRNASGKSNFVDALAFLRDAVRYNISDAINRRGGMGSLLCRAVNAKQFSIEVESVHLHEPSSERYLLEYALEVSLHSGGWPARPIADGRSRLRRRWPSCPRCCSAGTAGRAS